MDGAQRAVYDPVSHRTSLYTFKGGGVSRQEGKGDQLMVKKQLEDAFASGRVWHGRRKGTDEWRATRCGPSARDAVFVLMATSTTAHK